MEQLQQLLPCRKPASNPQALVAVVSEKLSYKIRVERKNSGTCVQYNLRKELKDTVISVLRDAVISGIQINVWNDRFNQVICKQAVSYRHKDGFLNFTTSKYKLHFFKTPSALKFIMNTDLSVGSMRDVLHQIFSSLFVEYIVRNPLCEMYQPITSELFKNKLDEYVQALPQFSAKTVS